MPASNFSVPQDNFPPAEIPHPVRPLKRTGGWVFPGRGMEAHGVDPNSSPPDPTPDVFNEELVHPAEQLPPERSTVPVPVRIVAEGSRESKEWRTFAESVGSDVRQIVGRNENRTHLIIKNSGTVKIWIGPDNRVSKLSAWPLDANETLSLEAYGAIYGVSDDGTEQPVSVVQEYVIEKP